MPKLPGVLDLGAATASPARPVGTYDPSGFGRGAAAIAAGAEAFGKGVSKLGEGAEEFDLDKSRWDYAKAHADFLSRKTDLDAESAQNTSYGPDENGKALPQRYEEKLKDLRSQSAALISNPRMRERFTDQTQPLVEQGIKAIAAHAKGLENNANVAYVEQQGDNFADKAVSATDDGTRAQLIYTYEGLVDGLVGRGARTPTEGLAMKQAWVQKYATADVLAARNSGDPARIEAAYARLNRAPGSPEDLTNRIVEIEGSGKNARSSAAGTGQFIGSTWLDVLKRNRPDLANGRGDDELLALRAGRGLGREMTEVYRRENEGFLKG
jgi:hypothetical protein